MSLIGALTVKLSTATFESEAIVNSVQQRSYATIKPVMIARSSTIFASRALADKAKEECQEFGREKQLTPMVQRLEESWKEASTRIRLSRERAGWEATERFEVG